MHQNNKNIKVVSQLRNSEFQFFITSIIDDYLISKNLSQKEFAKKCRLHLGSITRLKRGEFITKQILMIIFLTTHTTIEDAELIFELAGCTLGQKNNTDIAYRYFLSNNYNLDDAEYEIIKSNEYLSKKFKNLSKNDTIVRLHRKDII